MPPILYAVLCVAVPMAWGLVVVWVSNRVERAVAKRSKSKKPVPVTEYYI